MASYLTMTPAEIVAEYKQAKVPMQQIAILADLNCCTKKEIVQVLLDAGCSVPGQYLPKPKKDEIAKTAQAEKAPEIPKTAPAPKTYTLEELKAIALDLIGELVLTEASDYFAEQVRGIFQLIKEVEDREKRD